MAMFFHPPKIDVPKESLFNHRRALRHLQPIADSEQYLPHTNESINTF